MLAVSAITNLAKIGTPAVIVLQAATSITQICLRIVGIPTCYTGGMSHRLRLIRHHNIVLTDQLNLDETICN